MEIVYSKGIGMGESIHILFRRAVLCIPFFLGAFGRVDAANLSLSPSDPAVGAYSTSSQTYDLPTGVEERHFSYRIPPDLVTRDPDSVPIILLLHGGIPSDAGDEQFMQTFLEGLDETARPFSDHAYISVRAAEITTSRCLHLFGAGRIDEHGRNVCVANAAAHRHQWRFAGASASSQPDPDLPDAYSVFDPESYADVLALHLILRDFADTFPSLDLSHVFIATFSYGSHVADQVICSQSSMVRGVASITGSWLTHHQFGPDGALGGADGAYECGSGHEPGFSALTGVDSDAYGRRDATGYPDAGGQLFNRVPVFRSIGLADHNLTEGLTASVAADTMAWLNGVENRVSRVAVLPDIDRTTDDGKAITIAAYRRPAAGDTRRTARLLLIGECGLSRRGGRPAFDPRVVPSADGPGCGHGVWGHNNDEDVGTDRNWPTLAVRFFSRL